jgi:uncharacterized protein
LNREATCPSDRLPRRAAVRALAVAAFGWACFVLLLSAVAVPSIAQAQDRFERRSIIDMIFGPRRAQEHYPPPPQAVPQRQQQQQPRARQGASGGGGQGQQRQSAPRQQNAAVPPPPTAVDKAENAQKLLVIGDFMASGLAEGLEAAFADSANVVVLQRTNGSSGLVRDDYYDWTGSLPAILEEIDPDIAIVMLGSNDRQQLRVDGSAVDVHSTAWQGEYARRVRALAAVVRQSDTPLVWVGAPAFQSPRMSADILEINDIYRDEIAQAGGDFVDIWDGFVDEAGAFIFTGSDIQGQQVRLRGSDGINMTGAGKRKIAFYAEKPIRRLLEDPSMQPDGLIAGLAPGDTAVLLPELEEPELVVRTPPIGITDPALDGGDVLLGAAAAPDSSLKTPRDALVEDGLGTDAPLGRADHFVWPRKPAGSADIEKAAQEARKAGTEAAIATIIRDAEDVLSTQ